MSILLILSTAIPLHNVDLSDPDNEESDFVLQEATGKNHSCNRLLKAGIASNAQAVADKLASINGATDLIQSYRDEYVKSVHSVPCDLAKAGYFAGLIQQGVSFLENIPAFAPKKAKSASAASKPMAFYHKGIRQLLARFFTEEATLDKLDAFIRNELAGDKRIAFCKEYAGLPDAIVDLKSFLILGRAGEDSDRGVYSVQADAEGDGLLMIDVPTDIPESAYGKPGAKSAVNLCILNSVWRAKPAKKEATVATTATEAAAPSAEPVTE